MLAVSVRLPVNRAINQCRCWVSYALSRMGMVHFHHLPTFVSIEPANYCPLACPQCPVGRRKGTTTSTKRLLSMEEYETILAGIERTVHTIQFYFQGEPLLNHDLPKMIRRAHDRGIYTIVSTNAQTLSAEMAHDLMAAGLNRIIVSMDGLTQATYEQYRVGGHLDRVIDALRDLRREKEAQHASCRIILQCLYLRSNESEWKLLRRSYRHLGADRLEMKTAQFYDYENGNPLMPSDLRYARYQRDKEGHYHLRKPLTNHCYRLWSGAVVDVNGNVRPCCYDKDGQYIFGNIFSQSLSEIYWGPKADAFRCALLSSRRSIPMCQNCD